MATPVPTSPPSSGEAVVAIAGEHVGDRYVLGILVPKDNPNWKGPWDCAEFVSWAVFQSTGSLYGCNQDDGNPSSADAYTGYWERDAKDLGEIVSVERAARTPGAAVLRIPQLGASGHIVISDGAGGTVEAHSPTDGVIRSTLANRRWDTGILISGITYTQKAGVSVPLPSTRIYRLMLPMMVGNKVREIQQALLEKGFDPGSLDGDFGTHTHAAVVAFQLSKGLLPDGEVGQQTAAALGVQL